MTTRREEQLLRWGLCRQFLHADDSTDDKRSSLRAKVIEGEPAEIGTVLPQVDRSKDTLFFASDQSLAYLDGSLPADYGFGERLTQAVCRLHLQFLSASI